MAEKETGKGVELEIAAKPDFSTSRIRSFRTGFPMRR